MRVETAESSSEKQRWQRETWRERSPRRSTTLSAKLLSHFEPAGATVLVAKFQQARRSRRSHLKCRIPAQACLPTGRLAPGRVLPDRARAALIGRVRRSARPATPPSAHLPHCPCSNRNRPALCRHFEKSPCQSTSRF